MWLSETNAKISVMPTQWHRMTATISVLTGVKLKSGWQSALSIHLSRVFSYTPFSVRDHRPFSDTIETQIVYTIFWRRRPIYGESNPS